MIGPITAIILAASFVDPGFVIQSRPRVVGLKNLSLRQQLSMVLLLLFLVLERMPVALQVIVVPYFLRNLNLSS